MLARQLSRCVATAVVLTLVAAGCESGETIGEATVPPLVVAGVLPPVVAPGEVPYEPPGFVWGGEAAPLGLLIETTYGWAAYPDAVFFYQPPISARCMTRHPDQSDVRYAIVSGVYLGAEDRQVWWPVGAATDPRDSHSVIALVFDFGPPPGGVDPVVGRFYVADAAGPDPSRSKWFGDVSWTPVLRIALMNRRWLWNDAEAPPPLPNETDVRYGGWLTYEELPDQADPQLVVGRQYALELPIEGHPSVDCRYQFCIDEEPTDTECRDMTTPVKDMRFFEAENRAIVSALKGEAPLGDSTVGLVSWLHDPFPGRYDEPAVFCFACGLGHADPADPFPPFEGFPLPPSFYFASENESGRREWCHRDGCTLIDALVSSDEPEAFWRYLDALGREGWTVTEVGDGVLATSPDGLITMSILAADHDLSQHLRSIDEPADYLVLVSTWGFPVFRGDMED